MVDKILIESSYCASGIVVLNNYLIKISFNILQRFIEFP